MTETPDLRCEVTYDGVTYAPGQKFTVTQTPTFLVGYAPDQPPPLRYPSRTLKAGDEIVCAGWGPHWWRKECYAVGWHDPKGELGVLLMRPALFTDVEFMGGSVESSYPKSGHVEAVAA